VKKNFNFVYCFDNGYNKQGFTSIFSLLENIDRKIIINIIHPSSDLEKVIPNLILNHKNLKKIIIHKFKYKINDFPNLGYGHVSEATYYRLFLSEFIDEEVEYLIYLDADVLCLKNPIQEIEKSIEDLKHSNLIISAKTEYQFSEENEDIKRLNKKGPYFNAGVMVINFDLWKSKQLDQKLIEHMKLIENDIKYWDQDVLNSYFDEKYFSMNQYLNFNISTDKELVFQNPSEIKSINFLHFSGNLKPWTIEGSFSVFSEYYHFYYRSIYKSNYHITSKWRLNTFIYLLKNIFNLKIFKLKYPLSFIKENLIVIFFS